MCEKQIHTLVLIRHGESQWNIENRFTGWVDVPLAPSGVAESHRAATEIMKEGLEFDIVYTSTLKRAIKTAWNILEDTDAMHTPVVQDWRLNERMYGALQGVPFSVYYTTFCPCPVDTTEYSSQPTHPHTIAHSLQLGCVCLLHAA